MDFMDVVKARRSVRAYKPDAIPESSIKRVAEAVALAPSACNLQPVKTLLVTAPALKAKICEVYTRDWLKQAPAIVAVAVDESSAWKRVEGDSIADVDGAIVMENIVLAAAAEGLGSCWICAFDRKKMDAALGLKSPWRSFAISPLGFAAAEPKKTERKALDATFQVIK